jgi:DNA ligase-1
MGFKTYMSQCIKTLVSGKNKGGRCSRKATIEYLCTQHYKPEKTGSQAVNIIKQDINGNKMVKCELFSSSTGVLLANNFFDKNKKKKIDPVGWWSSEKYDGIRAIWTGQKLMSRTGNEINAPETFLSLLPSDTSFDGELFTKRGAFSKTLSIVSKKIPLQHEWDNILFYIFDIPHLRDTFENRVDILEKTIKNINSRQILSVKHIKIQSYNHLIQFHDNVISNNGEGIILRKPYSLYEPKRSNTFLKVKMFKDDDAIVIGYEYGNGRLHNALGSIIVRWVYDTSVVFNVGTGLDDSIRFGDFSNTLPIGSLISVKYFELDSKSGKPRFPVFLGKRFEQSLMHKYNKN